MNKIFNRADYVSDPERVKAIFNYSIEQAKMAKDEKEWYANVKEKALNWI